MQVQSKKTLNLNELLGTKAQGSDTEVSNTEQGEMFFSELLGDAVAEDENQDGEAKVKGENQEELLTELKSTDVTELNSKDVTESEEVVNQKSNTEISDILNKGEQATLNLKQENTGNQEVKVETLLVKTGNKLQSLLNKVSENKTEGLEISETVSADFKDVKNDKKNFLNEILGKVTKVSGEESQLTSNKNKASELRINAEFNPALMKASVNKKNSAGMNQYKKEITSLNESLVSSPVHSQLVENNKLLDENGMTKIQQAESSEYGSVHNIESAQNLDLGNGSDSQKDNFASQKVLDLSQIKADSKVSLIKEVSNYIEQSYVSNQDTVDLVVKHDELGSFRILAQKSGPGNQVNLEINTVTKQAEAFFLENESELIKNLQSGGVKLSSVKVVAKPEFLFTMEGGKSGNMEQSLDSGRQQSFHGRGEQKQQSSSQGFSDGRDRRGELWQQAQEFSKKYAA